MDVSEYFQSLSDELTSLKDRIRYVVDDAHWLTDGEWKESVLRSTLQRHLPANVGIGTGFVVSSRRTSTQIDVLLYDNTKPVLFRAADLVMITPDACLGIIEVKSKIASNTDLRRALRKLADNSAILGRRTEEEAAPFIGLFSYEWGGQNLRSTLEHLREFGRSRRRVINHVTLGPSRFVRFWDRHPVHRDGAPGYNHWHGYELADRSFGYFVNNAVEAACRAPFGENSTLWFPRDGKEGGLRASLAARWHPTR